MKIVRSRAKERHYFCVHAHEWYTYRCTELRGRNTTTYMYRVGRKEWQFFSPTFLGFSVVHFAPLCTENGTWMRHAIAREKVKRWEKIFILVGYANKVAGKEERVTAVGGTEAGRQEWRQEPRTRWVRRRSSALRTFCMHLFSEWVSERCLCLGGPADERRRGILLLRRWKRGTKRGASEWASEWARHPKKGSYSSTVVQWVLSVPST